MLGILTDYYMGLIKNLSGPFEHNFYQYFLTEWPKEKTLPKPNIFCLTPASCHDLKAFVLVAENMEFYENFADTAYANQSLQKLLKQKQQTDLI